MDKPFDERVRVVADPVTACPAVQVTLTPDEAYGLVSLLEMSSCHLDLKTALAAAAMRAERITERSGHRRDTQLARTDPLDRPRFWQGDHGTYCEKCQWDTLVTGDDGVREWESHAHQWHPATVTQTEMRDDND